MLRPDLPFSLTESLKKGKEFCVMEMPRWPFRKNLHAKLPSHGCVLMAKLLAAQGMSHGLTSTHAEVPENEGL